MRLGRIGICLWPGLVPLWKRGSMAALVLAFACSIALNALFVLTLIWPEWVGASWKVGGWAVLSAIWGWGIRYNYRMLPISSSSNLASPDEIESDLFLRAQSEYLRGNWFEVEGLLNGILHRDAGDVEARLLLATMFRRTTRPSQAEKQLRLLEQCERGVQWQLEIEAERRFIQAETREQDVNEDLDAAVHRDAA